MKERLRGLHSHLCNRLLGTYWSARSRNVFKHLQLSRSDRVLELGSGRGVWTAYVAPRVRRLVAVEPDRSQIREAREWRSFTTPVRPVEQVDFLQGDASKLPFATGSFDKVFAIDVIEHIANDQAVIREAARVLRPRGRLVLTTLRHDRPAYVRRATFGDHLREYDEEMLSRLLEGCGFEQPEWFSFCFGARTLAMEAELMMPSLSHPLLQVIPVSISALIGAPEWFVKLGRPSGIGLSVRKH